VALPVALLPVALLLVALLLVALLLVVQMLEGLPFRLLGLLGQILHRLIKHHPD